MSCTQEEADQAPGGAVFAQLQAGSPSVTCAQPQGVRFQPGAWSLQVVTSYMPPPAVQSTVKTLTVDSIRATVQHGKIHIEFTHNEQYSVL